MRKMANSQACLEKDYIIRAVIDMFEKGFGTTGALVVLSENWHYVIGDIIYTDHWEEMGFIKTAKLDELILNLPSEEDVKNGKINFADLMHGYYNWQLASHCRDIEIIWQ